MKKLLTLAFLAISTLCYSQDTLLDEKDGISISYKLTKIKETTKKDTYYITCKAVNTTNEDLYYEGPENKVNPFFATITVRNNKSFLYLTALESKLSSGKKVLFYLKKGGSVSAEKEVTLEKGVTPILTVEFLNVFKSITEYR